jgi:hypothetical protein
MNSVSVYIMISMALKAMTIRYHSVHIEKAWARRNTCMTLLYNGFTIFSYCLLKYYSLFIKTH